jgi:hypothetical protein
MLALEKLPLFSMPGICQAYLALTAVYVKHIIGIWYGTIKALEE